MEKDLLGSLNAVRWDIIFKTYGNSHSTLIGLLVDWWISSNPQHRYVLEPGFSPGYNLKNVGGSICDAVLVEKEIIKGVVEVEGSRYEKTLLKIEKLFQAENSGYRTLEFGIFLAYQTKVSGRGRNRKIEPFRLEELTTLGGEITKKFPNKQLVILILEKEYTYIKSGIRSRAGGYYMGNSTRVSGILMQNGQEISKRILQYSIT